MKIKVMNHFDVSPLKDMLSSIQWIIFFSLLVPITTVPKEFTPGSKQSSSNIQ